MSVTEKEPVPRPFIALPASSLTEITSSMASGVGNVSYIVLAAALKWSLFMCVLLDSESAAGRHAFSVGAHFHMLANCDATDQIG